LFEEKVREYAGMIRRREKIQPTMVYHDGQNYWLADGFHRVTAAQRLGRKRIKATIVPGTYTQSASISVRCRSNNFDA
jgi:ParB-like chromosome segregation protein Spo0J